MRRSVTISTGLIPVSGRPMPAPQPEGSARRFPLRSISVMFALVASFAIVAGQLVRLASLNEAAPQVSISMPLATGYARPDLVDRNGRLLASDVELPSLYADPYLVVDRDETVEKLATIFPDIDNAQLRATLGDRSKRFVWIKRGLSPAVAQRVHNLGLPGLSFRQELRRAYPSGKLAGHLLGGVNVDNRAVGGIEHYLDEARLIDPVVAAQPTSRPAVALSIDMRVQHALEQELGQSVTTYKATGAAGLVLDVTTGEVIASASLPQVDPAHPDDSGSVKRIDRITGGTYELGSIFKLLTVAMALDGGRVSPDTQIDVSKPLEAGRFEFKDHHGSGRPLTVTEIFTKSSNVGAGILALDEGTDRQKAFLKELHLTQRTRTEAGALAEPQLPVRWDRAETITISFGHGLAVTPLQFAAAAAAMVNGGTFKAPTFLKRGPVEEIAREHVISEKTSARLREMMRRNVAEPGGTGRRAEAAGYDVGGKTGTAEIAVRGRYDRNAVIASFVAAFPIAAPRYLSLVLIFRPARTAASAGEITASHTAAPVTSRLISRIAPLLDLPPRLAASDR